MTTNFKDSTNRYERALFVPSYDSLLSVRLLPQYIRNLVKIRVIRGKENLVRIRVIRGKRKELVIIRVIRGKEEVVCEASLSLRCRRFHRRAPFGRLRAGLVKKLKREGYWVRGVDIRL